MTAGGSPQSRRSFLRRSDSAVEFLLSTPGRIARVVLGAVLIFVGLGVVGGFLGVLLMILGAAPIVAAAMGWLLIGPLLGRDINGRREGEEPPEEEPQGEPERETREE